MQVGQTLQVSNSIGLAGTVHNSNYMYMITNEKVCLPTIPNVHCVEKVLSSLVMM